MSMSILLVPLAIALCISASETVGAVTEKCRNHEDTNSNDSASLIQTRFNDASLLSQTLVEHGLNVQVLNENELMVSSRGGKLKYIKPNLEGPFFIELHEVIDVDCLVSDLNELENEYDRNVQSFTYHKVLDNLPPEMTVVEDTVLEDDSIKLTIAVRN